MRQLLCILGFVAVLAGPSPVQAQDQVQESSPSAEQTAESPATGGEEPESSPALAASAIGVRRDSLEMTGILIKMLNLSTPALFPTGHALRDAGYTHPAIDLRHSPHLPTVDLPSLEIFYGSPAANRRDS